MGMLTFREKKEEENEKNKMNLQEQDFQVLLHPNYLFPHSTSPSFSSAIKKTILDQSESFSSSCATNISSNFNQSIQLTDYKNDLIHQSLKPPPKDFTSPNLCKSIQKDVTRKYQRSISSKTHSRRNRENLCISSIENIIIKTNYNDVDYVNSFSRNEEIRNTYLKKLINKNILSQKNKTHNTLFIFDWDDTLLCTSYLSPGGYFNENKKLNKKEQYKISISEEYVYQILSKSLEKGEVYIITNSGPGWVEFSCNKFYPKVFPLLNVITIISARGLYERQYPGDTKLWKLLAFKNIANDFNKELITNIICVGDNIIEIEAGHTLSEKFNKAYIKTVKFREKSKIEELNKELKLICQQFNEIYSTVKNLKIRVEKRKKDEFTS